MFRHAQVQQPIAFFWTGRKFFTENRQGDLEMYTSLASDSNDKGASEIFACQSPSLTIELLKCFKQHDMLLITPTPSIS